MGALDRIAKAILGGKVGGPHPGGIYTYHSSPHDFEKFDWSKLRSGEGANVYGAGFYSAESPKVSGQGGEYWSSFKDRFPVPEQQAAQAMYLNNWDRAAAIENARRQVETYEKRGFRGKEMADSYRDELKVLESNLPIIGPRTYELNLRVKPDELLDWDKPMSQQGKNVQEFSAAQNFPYAVTDPLGQGLYQRLGMRLRDNQAASEVLREAGIPGIRYLDQGSRHIDLPDHLVARMEENAGALSDLQSLGVEKWTRVDMARANVLDAERRALSQEADAYRKANQTYNYVMFDPSKIDIMAKYALPGAVGLGALAAGADRADAAQPATFDQRFQGMGGLATQDQYGAQ